MTIQLWPEGYVTMTGHSAIQLTTDDSDVVGVWAVTALAEIEVA